MILAYDEQGLTNRLICRRAEKAADSHLISSAEREAIKKAYPDDFYSPNIFMRIGLGLLTFTATWSVGIWLLAAIKPKTSIPFYLIIFAALFLFLLEWLIRKYHHYRSGVDDMLLYSALLFIYLALLTSRLTDKKDFHLLLAFTMTLAGTLSAIWYVDRLAAIQAYLAGAYLACALWYKLGEPGMVTMPMLVISIGIFTWQLMRYFRNSPFCLHYVNGMKALEVLSLCTIYVAGNFWVDDWWWVNRFNVHLDYSAWKFASLAITAFFPLWCLWSGILRHDLTRIRLAVLMTAASLFTFHYYMGVMPDELVMMVYGAIMIVLAYVFIQRLKRGIPGYTYESANDNSSWVELEELVTGGSFSERTSSSTGDLSP